jgi:hypothetical protein
MVKGLKDRLGIIKLTLRHSKLLWVFGILQLFPIILRFLPPSKTNDHMRTLSMFMPWYGWVIGWIVLLWFASIEYSVKRKEVFDETSIAFFKAYLDSLIKQGNHLFNYSEQKDFYSKINEWQHQVIQGIAIGLGPQASQKYFHEMDKKNPTGETSQTALTWKTSDTLCRVLQENIEELNRMRLDLAEPRGGEKDGIETGTKVNLLGESK